MKRIGTIFGVAVLLTMGIVSVAFAADGVQKESIWQQVAGLFGILTAGGGAVLWRNVVLLKHAKDAIDAYIQVPAAVQLFMRTATKEMLEDPEFMAMIRKIDRAFEETADVLDGLNHKKQADMLRNVIKADGDVLEIQNIFDGKSLLKSTNLAINLAQSRNI